MLKRIHALRKHWGADSQTFALHLSFHSCNSGLKPTRFETTTTTISTTISNKQQDFTGQVPNHARQAEGLGLGDLTLQFANALLTLTSTVALSEQVRMAHTLITLEPTLGIKIPTPKSVWTSWKWFVLLFTLSLWFETIGSWSSLRMASS